jgi:hypothetical protein
VLRQGRRHGLGYCCHSWVLPSMSVNRKVTVPLGRSIRLAAGWLIGGGADGGGRAVGVAPPAVARFHALFHALIVAQSPFVWRGVYAVIEP